MTWRYSLKIWQAAKHYKQLPYTFIYLIGFFLLADVRLLDHPSALGPPTHVLPLQGLNTTVALVAICQNDKFSFSFLQTTYLGLAQAITSTISTLTFWYVQRYFKIPTKKMVHNEPFYLIFNAQFFWPTVYRDKRCNCIDTSLGHDRYLDAEIWVSWPEVLSLG